MGGVFAAYMVTTTLIMYRWVTEAHQAPPPLSLAGEALIFGASALIAQRDVRLGTATAWAFTIGALLAPDLTKTAGPSTSSGSSTRSGSSSSSSGGGSGGGSSAAPPSPLGPLRPIPNMTN